MNNVARILLLAGALILALLVGVLIGRRERPEPATGNAAAMQITTEAPVAPVAPLPAPVQAPKAAAIPRVSADQQVQDDAAAVGMTTTPEAAEPAPPPAKSAPPETPDAGNAQPAG